MSEAKLQSGNADQEYSSAPLSAKLDKSLFAYAAAAAGVSLLAQSAEAKIVYTPANIPLSSVRYFSLDLNNDGIRDFIFSVWEFHGYGLEIKTTKLRPQNGIMVGNFNSASALSSGITVGPNAQFQTGRHLMAEDNCSSGICSTNGPWRQAQSKYLGLSFIIQGKVHYGWARLNVNANNIKGTAVVTGYAYETVASTPIVTGQTQGADEVRPEAVAPGPWSAPARQVASLGLLARGASGMEAWRREKE
jgi:hypothetical protein